jgi:Co/Zn/Cd efflux system component
MNYCGECGAKLGKNWEKCHNCGAPLYESDKQGTVSSNIQIGSKTYFTEEILDAVGCILLIIGIAFLAVIFYFFREWFDLIIPVVILIIVLGCVARIIYAAIGEAILKLKERKKSKNKIEGH